MYTGMIELRISEGLVPVCTRLHGVRLTAEREGVLVSVGEFAGLLAALAAVVLVALCAVPLIKLGGVMDELRTAVRDLGTSTTPILEELKGTVATTTDEIARLSQVTEELTRMSQNASTMAKQAADVSTVVSTPLVKTAEVVGKGAHAVGKVAGNVRRRREATNPSAPQLPAGSLADRTGDELATGDPLEPFEPHPYDTDETTSSEDDHESR